MRTLNIRPGLKSVSAPLTRRSARWISFSFWSLFLFLTLSLRSFCSQVQHLCEVEYIYFFGLKMTGTEFETHGWPLPSTPSQSSSRGNTTASCGGSFPCNRLPPAFLSLSYNRLFAGARTLVCFIEAHSTQREDVDVRRRVSVGTG